MSDSTIFVSTLELPDPYNLAEVGAWVEYGRRKVCLTLKDPGTIHRCRYEMAWIDIQETQPWKGEPLWVTGHRRPPGAEWSRTVFTPAATKAMGAEILPIVARFGFSSWWLEIHRATKGETAKTESDAQRVEAERLVQYHARRAELGELYGSGLVDVVPVEGVRVEELDYDMRWKRSDAAARLVFGDDDIGWITREGKLVPS